VRKLKNSKRDNPTHAVQQRVGGAVQRVARPANRVALLEMLAKIAGEF
jgi:hypothetical protein